MKSTATFMAGAALAFVACSPSGFNTPTLLNNVRILAIQAEPPQPALGASTTLRALVYQPPLAEGADAGVTITGYRWSWCPLPMSFDDPSQCPIGQAQADQLLAGIPGVQPLDLGSGEIPTTTFTNPFPAAMLASLCNNNLEAIPGLATAASSMGGLAATGGRLFKCTIAGFPITVKVVVTTSDGKEYPAVVSVYLPINDAIAPNVNPVVGSVYAMAESPGLQLDEAGTQQLLRDSRVPLVLDMPLSDSEILPDPNQVLPSINPKDPNSVLGPNDTSRERLYVYWFAECGDFGGRFGEGGETTGYLGNDPNDPVSPFSLALHNFWNIPKLADYHAPSARITLVVGDSRGGVTWTSGLARLVETPPDAGASDTPQADAAEVSSPPDAGASDAPQADAGEVSSPPDAGASDAPEPEPDTGEPPDAGAPDLNEGNSADALLETAP